MKNILKTVPYLVLTWICIFCGTFLWVHSLSAAPISTIDSAGEPFYIEEEIEKAPDQYLQSMEDFLRKGQLDAIGVVAKILTQTKGDDPRVPAMFSIYLSSKKDLNAATTKLQEARRAGDTLFAQYAEAMILRLEKKYPQAERACEHAISMDKSHPFPWNVLGRIQFDQGELTKAYTSFQKSVDLEPDFLPGYINLGASADILGNEEASISHFKKAIQINPRASEAHLGLGLVYFKTGQYELAVNEFETTLALDPKNLSVLQELGTSQIMAKRYAKALETGRQMEKEGLPDANIILGKASLYLGKTQEAIKYLEKSLPNHPEVNTLLGFCYMVQNQYAQALMSMEKTLKNNPGDFGAFLARAGLKFILDQEIDLNTDLKTGWGEALDKAVYFSRGCVLASKGEWKAATDEWRASENLIQGFSISGLETPILSQGMTKKGLPHLNLGMLYFFKNLYDPALAHFTIALDKNEDSILSNYFAAQVVLNQGDRSKAISYLERALVHAPNFFTALYSVAELELLAGNPDQAIKYYLRAIQVKKDPGILLKIGLYYENSAQFPEAEKYYRELITQEPELYLGYNQLAWLYAKRGIELDNALKLALKANDLRPGNASVLDTLGWICYHKKDYDKALTYLEQSEKVVPGNPTVLFHLGLTYYALENKTEARICLKKALEINGQFEGAEKAREILNINGLVAD